MEGVEDAWSGGGVRRKREREKEEVEEVIIGTTPMGVCGESLSASWRETGDARAETRLGGQLQIVYAWQHPFFSWDHTTLGGFKGLLFCSFSSSCPFLSLTARPHKGAVTPPQRMVRV